VRAVYLEHDGHGSGKIAEWAKQDTALYRRERNRR
jgi:hypothetical protein